MASCRKSSQRNVEMRIWLNATTLMMLHSVVHTSVGNVHRGLATSLYFTCFQSPLSLLISLQNTMRILPLKTLSINLEEMTVSQIVFTTVKESGKILLKMTHQLTSLREKRTLSALCKCSSVAFMMFCG